MLPAVKSSKLGSTGFLFLVQRYSFERMGGWIKAWVGRIRPNKTVHLPSLSTTDQLASTLLSWPTFHFHILLLFKLNSFLAWNRSKALLPLPWLLPSRFVTLARQQISNPLHRLHRLEAIQVIAFCQRPRPSLEIWGGLCTLQQLPLPLLLLLLISGWPLRLLLLL